MVGFLMFHIIMNLIPIDINQTTAFNDGGAVIDGAADIDSSSEKTDKGCDRRLTFSQIQKYLYNGTYPNSFDKETYNRKHLKEKLKVGTEVHLENTAQQQRKGGKMEPAWMGLYTINRCIGKGLYELKNS